MNANYRIQFEKPDLDALTGAYTVVDMHFHTNYSDGAHSVREIAELAGELGIGVAITDHNAIHGAVEIDRYKHLLTVPGIEITSREGTHLLIYFYEIRSLVRFYEAHVQPYMGRQIMSSIALPLDEVARRARRYRCVIIFPHPYSAAYTGVFNTHFPEEHRTRLFDLVDGIEAINAFNLHRWNMKSTVLAFNIDKAITGGSDGHSLDHLGRAVTFSECQSSRNAFLDAVLAGNVRVMGKEVHLIRKMTSNGARLKTNLRNTPDLMEKNLWYSYVYLNSKSKDMRDSLKRRLNGRHPKITV